MLDAENELKFMPAHKFLIATDITSPILAAHYYSAAQN